MRSKIRNVKADKRLFHNTATRTKKINVAPVVMRGGIRL